MRSQLVLVAVLAGSSLTACQIEIDSIQNDVGEQEVADGGVEQDPAAGPMITRAFTETEDDLLNPERGYHVSYDLRGGGDAGDARTEGKTLAITIVRLDAYRSAALDAALLDSLEAGFAAARAGGIKVILRFTYNSSLTADASRARILGHLEQLTPLLSANADVIAVMQAGFIGAWGEWHTSTNGLDNTADRTAILDAILAALPSSRGVQVRTPMIKAASFPGGPLVEDEAHDGSARARVGHHNDCFLASASDLGTYASPVDTWSSYVADDGRFTAIGGETCQLAGPRTQCATAIAEMEDKHWSYLNSEYKRTVLAAWDAEGCGDEIRRRLGYRFALDQIVHSEAVAPGGALYVEIDLHNSGFASPFNRRPVDVVLDNGTTRIVTRLDDVDARQWAPGATVTLATTLRLPTDATPGHYTLSLRLPDEAATLAEDPRYSIGFASPGVWNKDTGDNVLSTFDVR